MKQHHSTIILLFAGALIGLFIVIHLKTPFIAESDFPTEEIEARDDLFKSYLDEQSYLQSRIVSLRKEIETAQEAVVYQSETNNLAYLDKLKKYIGLTEASGKGLEIYLDDSPFALREGAEVSDVNLVQAADLRDIANVLNAAGAEAVSINGQRIIGTSTIISVGTTILINNTYTAPPFTINAVGDTELMLQRILDRSVLPDIHDRAKSSKLVFEILVKNTMIIPIYNVDLKANYLTLVK